jgi:NADH dehydrogenase
VIRRRRLVVSLPFWLGGLMAAGFDLLETVTLGLIHNGVLTRDQLKSLRRDTVVAEDARGFADLGIEPAAMEAVLPDYLWRFRPSGQYAEIKESARNLRSR